MRTEKQEIEEGDVIDRRCCCWYKILLFVVDDDDGVVGFVNNIMKKQLENLEDDDFDQVGIAKIANGTKWGRVKER